MRFPLARAGAISSDAASIRPQSEAYVFLFFSFGFSSRVSLFCGTERERERERERAYFKTVLLFLEEEGLLTRDNLCFIGRFVFAARAFWIVTKTKGRISLAHCLLAFLRAGTESSGCGRPRIGLLSATEARPRFHSASCIGIISVLLLLRETL